MAPVTKDTRLYRQPKSRFWWARIRLVDGSIKRVSTRCTDEHAASLWADENERRAAPGYRPPATCSLGDALTAYAMNLQQRGRSEGTQQKVAVKALALLSHFGETLPARLIDGASVLAYIDARSLPYGPKHKTRSRSTIAMEVQVLVAALKLARFAGLFDGDPDALVPPWFSGSAEARTTWLSRDEAERLVEDGFRGRGRRSAALERAGCVAFILGSGCRMSGLMLAKRSDIDFAANTVTVRDTKTVWGVRTIPITPLMRPWLELALTLGRGDREGNSRTHTGRLFSRWAKPQRDIALACTAAGVPTCTPNDLRRTFAQWHDRAGVPPKILSAMMGHAPGSKTTEKHYAQTSAETLAAALEGVMHGMHTGMSKRVPETTFGAQNDATEAEREAPNRIVSAEKVAPAAGVEPATNALGKRWTDIGFIALAMRGGAYHESAGMRKRRIDAEKAASRWMRRPVRVPVSAAIAALRGYLLSI